MTQTSGKLWKSKRNSINSLIHASTYKGSPRNARFAFRILIREDWIDAFFEFILYLHSVIGDRSWKYNKLWIGHKDKIEERIFPLMNISTAACNSFYQGYHLVLYNSTTLWVLSDPRWSSIFDWRLGRGKSKLLVILSRIRWCSVTSEQNTILIILISLILFLIKLVESLTSTRKVPRVLCTKMRKLGWMDIELVWMPIGRHVVRNDVHRCHLVFLLPFHPTVLEPYFDLSFGQAESVSYFDPSSSCQISVKMEFLLQLKSLITRVRCSLSFSFSIGVYCTCNYEN